jgi:hypothetical protein
MMTAEDIIEMLQALPVRVTKAARLDRKGIPTTNLYFVQTDCAEGHIKIGVGANVIYRIAQMQTGCPYTLKLLKIVRNASHFEKALHAEFAADNLHGEWFRKTDRLLQVIDVLEGFDPCPPPQPIDLMAMVTFGMQPTS